MTNEEKIDWREDAKWTVYVHIVTKALSGHNHDKYYVGITSQSNPNVRWQNGNGYKKNEHFWRAIQKYGWDNIEHDIVAENLTKDEACKMEKALIRELNATNQIYGYNHTIGGEGVSYNFEDLSGKVFGFLRINSLSKETGNNGERKWDCTCLLCNSLTTKFENTIRAGTTISCGCYGRQVSKNKCVTHGMSYEKIYQQYRDLKGKCYNENNSGYYLFGKKGITVCNEWLEDFMNFYNWSIKNGYTEELILCLLPGETIYSPSTCVWKDKKYYYKYIRNTNCRSVTYKNETHSIKEWSELLGINYSTLKSRLKKLSPEEAFIK